MLDDDGNELYMSLASAWEIAIKSSLRKLSVEGGIGAILDRMEQGSVSLIPIAPRHLTAVEGLPFIHRDPFDRMLVAVAKTDGMTILTADTNIRKYEVPSAW
jgi:PIN domain nuclease of toxin-antitoxin system